MQTRYGQVGAEPFEEDWRGKNASQEKVALNKFYHEQEMKDRERRQLNLERKQSGKRRSGSLWRRKSNKDSSSSNNAPTREQPAPAPAHEREMAELEAATAASMNPTPNRSLVPEVMRDASTANTRDLNTPISLNVRYNIHNPVGPRWYKNYHLLAPHEARPDARPSSFFSPDFPPMASSSSIRMEESRGSRRPPSVQSPASSQVRVAEKPTRTRKTSQTSPDNVDFLDGSDPWGQNFHHTSPYDVSSPTDRLDPHISSQTRSRVSSVTTQSQKHRTINPSPLSQSTSAVHLTTQSTTTINRIDLSDTHSHDETNRPSLPRKLSKRRTPGLGFFNGRSVSAGSPPGTPEDSSGRPSPSPQPPSSKRDSRQGPPPSNPAAFAAATKKDRRSSILSRLTKKLSVYKRPKSGTESGRTSRASQEMQEASLDDVRMQNEKLSGFVNPSPERSPSPEKGTDIPLSTPEPQPQPETEPPQLPQLEPQSRVDSIVDQIDHWDYSVSNALSAYPQPISPPPTAPEPEPEPVSAPAESAPSPLVVAPAPAPAEVPAPVTVSSPVPTDVPAEVPTPKSPKRRSQAAPSQPIKQMVSPPPQLPSEIVSDKGHRISIASYEEVAFSVGKLTVANPDLPSVENTPVQQPLALPPPRQAQTVPLSPPHQLPTGARAPNPYPFQSNRAHKSTSSTQEKEKEKPFPQPTKREKSSSPVKRPSSRSPTKRQKPRSRSPSPEKAPFSTPPIIIQVPRRYSEERPRTKSSRSPTKQASAATMAAQHDLLPPPRIPAVSGLNFDSPANSSTSMLPNYGSPIPTIPDLPSTPETMPPPLPEKEVVRPAPITKRDLGMNKSNRSTETFKLIRSASGTVYASGETIHANGHAWEVVEEQDMTRRKSSRDHLADGVPTKRSSRRERQPSVELMNPSKEIPSKRASKRVSAQALDGRDSYPATSSSGSNQPPAVPPKKSGSSSKEKDRGRERERKTSRHSTQTVATQKSGANLHREPSGASNRPTSEMFPTAELNDLRAKEAWDLERLYKGRSMYGEELRQQIASPPPPPLPSKDVRPSASSRQSHGSSHTSFMVQAPFAGPAQQQKRRSTTKSTSNRTSADDVFKRSSNNPLPPPPRESTFQPNALRDSDPKSSEYWRQYAGVVGEAH